eukprot:TRINITY_DN34763_c0_g1_i2.p1 TRINITY_DN34763_c0_g1~~TRINITY_DN34763_c0_g1_i2.p1  ORF type:complete len:123 (-),score=11.42 TRINITY_DN34763_c0_g1_i2:82-450(-)
MLSSEKKDAEEDEREEKEGADLETASASTTFLDPARYRPRPSVERVSVATQTDTLRAKYERALLAENLFIAPNDIGPRCEGGFGKTFAGSYHSVRVDVMRVATRLLWLPHAAQEREILMSVI